MKNPISRRNFLAGTAAVGAGTLGVPGAHAAIDAAFNRNFKAPEKCFMDQYFDGAMTIVGISLSIKAIGPCFSSPPANPSA